MRRFFFLLVLTHFSLVTSAQDMLDVIHLTNGSIIKGKIIEQNESQIKIETCCGNTFVYDSKDIKSTYKVENVESKLKSTGYLNFTSLGVLIGSDKDEKPAPLSILMEHNYKLNKYFAIGGVVGLEMLNETVVPVGINSKAFIPFPSGEYLYLGLSGGYSISLENPKSDFYSYIDSYGGYFVNTEVGLIISSKQKTRFYVALGYRYNELNYKREDWRLTKVDQLMLFNRLSLKMGVLFF